MFSQNTILVLSLATLAELAHGHGQLNWPMPRQADGSGCTNRGDKGPECGGNDHPMYFWGGGKSEPRRFDYISDAWAKNWKSSMMQC
eukprot:Pgem_evm1s6820